MLTAIGNAKIYGPELLFERGTIVFDEQEIVYVGESFPEGMNIESIIDGTECYVVPGLIDSHVHLTMDPDADPWPKLQDPDATIALRGARNARQTLFAGITTVRDLGAKNYIDISLRNAINQGFATGPRMLVAGKCICMTGGHGWMMGREADSPDEARKAAREQLRAGADVVKIMATGGVMTPGVEPGAAQLTQEEMAAAVAEAVRAGKKTATHAQGTAGIKNAVMAGIHSVEHGIFLDDEVCLLMAERGVYLVPTLSAPHWIIENGVEAGIPSWAVEKAKRCGEAHVKSFQLALKHGVPIAMGTDAGTPFNMHGQNAFELEMMVTSGMSPLQALKAATVEGAKLLGLNNIGSIKKGNAADILLLSEDPAQDVKVFSRAVKKVIKGGVVQL